LKGRDFHARLNQLGIAHEFIVVDGVGHNAMKLFEAMGDENCDFYRAVFEHTLPH
jgi:hypothetical protein